MNNNTKLWIFDINELFYNFNLNFSQDNCLEEQLNTVTRIIFIIFLLLICINVKISVIFLLFSLLFIIILYYIKRDMIKENYENQYTKIGHKPTVGRITKYADTDIEVTRNDSKELDCWGVNHNNKRIYMKLNKLNVNFSKYNEDKKQFQNLKIELLNIINKISEEYFPTLSDLKKNQLVDDAIDQFYSKKTQNVKKLLSISRCKTLIHKLAILNTNIKEDEKKIKKIDELSSYDLNSKETSKLLAALSHFKIKKNNIEKEIKKLLNTVLTHVQTSQLIPAHIQPSHNSSQRYKKLAELRTENRNLKYIINNLQIKIKASEKADEKRMKDSTYADINIENYDIPVPYDSGQWSTKTRKSSISIKPRDTLSGITAADSALRYGRETSMNEAEINLLGWHKVQVPNDLIQYNKKCLQEGNDDCIWSVNETPTMYKNKLTGDLSFNPPQNYDFQDYLYARADLRCPNVNDRIEIYKPSDYNKNNCQKTDPYSCPMTTFQKMIGDNPKTNLQPIIPLPLHSDEWNPHGVRVGINDSISIDQEMTGYHVKNKLDMNLNPQSIKQTELGRKTNNTFVSEIQPGIIGYFPKQNWNNNQSLSGNIQKCYNSKLIAPFNRDIKDRSIKNGSVITNLNEINPYKLVDQSKPNRFNVYDPRSGGYGDQNRAYVHNITGQTRYMYDDVDNIRNPNYITRNKLDMISNIGTTYGQMKPQHVTDPVYLRKQVHQSFLDNTLSFRNSLQYSTMIKGNNKVYAQKQAPIHR